MIFRSLFSTRVGAGETAVVDAPSGLPANISELTGLIRKLIPAKEGVTNVGLWLRDCTRRGVGESGFQDWLFESVSQNLPKTRQRSEARYWPDPSLLMFLVGLAAASLLGGCSEELNSRQGNMAAVLSPEQEFSAALKKSEAGDADSQYAVGRMLTTGEGVTKDLNKAIHWYQKAAQQGNTKAMVQLGRAYQHKGIRIDRSKVDEMAGDEFEGVEEDVKKAAEWYQKAADLGDANAQYVLGLAFDKLSNNNWLWFVIKHDSAKALEWYQKSANQGNTNAMMNLGSLIGSGEGAPKDEAKAWEWHLKAAAYGDSYAQILLGLMYESGNAYGGRKDLVLAYAWMNIASANDGSAISYRNQFERELSSSGRSEAQRLSSNWKKGQILVREGMPSKAAINSSPSSESPGKKGTGTVFLVSDTGHAITNQHVVGDCSELRIQGRDGVAKLVTADVVNDLALIQIQGVNKNFALISNEPSKLRQGEDIVVFGFPLNSLLASGGNLTPGVVSAMTGLGNNTNQIQITAPIQPGSSGSPVMNKKGEVVGVVSMKLSDSKMAKATGSIGQNVNFAVSGQTLKTFLDAHRVEYRTGGLLSFDKSTADLADEARKWTLVVECWR